jgi:hypothetical protein
MFLAMNTYWFEGLVPGMLIAIRFVPLFLGMYNYLTLAVMGFLIISWSKVRAVMYVTYSVE